MKKLKKQERIPMLPIGFLTPFSIPEYLYLKCDDIFKLHKIVEN